MFRPQIANMLKFIVKVALVLLVIGMVVPSTRARIEGAFGSLTDRVNAKLVPGRLESMADQLDVRLDRAEGFPGNFEGWLRRDFSGTPQDPWGSTYFLNVDRREYTVGSAGPDLLAGNADDITVTRPPPGARR